MELGKRKVRRSRQNSSQKNSMNRTRLAIHNCTGDRPSYFRCRFSASDLRKAGFEGFTHAVPDWKGTGIVFKPAMKGKFRLRKQGDGRYVDVSFSDNLHHDFRNIELPENSLLVDAVVLDGTIIVPIPEGAVFEENPEQE